MVPFTFIFFAKSVRIESVRIWIVFRIVMDAFRRDEDLVAFFKVDVSVWNFIIFGADSCEHRYWRIFP